MKTQVIWYPLVMPGRPVHQVSPLFTLRYCTKWGNSVYLFSSHLGFSTIPMKKYRGSCLPPLWSRYIWAGGIATVLVSTLLKLGVAGSARLETPALILQDKNYNALKGVRALTNDLLELGKFIANLEIFLSSLTEVALQT